MKNRVFYLLAAILILVTEVIIALFVNDAFIRPYGGDILVVILICCIVRAIFPTGISFLSVWVFFFALAVEIAQAMDIVSVLGLSDISFFRVLIGTSFSFIDILCYAFGCAVFWLAEKLIHKKTAQ